MAISWFEPRTLLGVWGQTLTKAPKTFLQDFLFTMKYYSRTENIDLDEVRATRGMASFSAIDGVGKTVTRAGFVANSYTPPALKPRIPLKQSDLNQRIAGEDLTNPLAPDARATAIMQQDLLHLARLNIRRREWMCAQLLATGAIAMVGDDYSQTVDYALTNTATLTVHDLWSDVTDSSTSHPIANLETWALAMAAGSGVVPTVAIMALDANAAFWAHPDVVADANKFANRYTTLQPADLTGFPGAMHVGWVTTPSGFTLEIITYVEWFETVAANGAVTRYPMIPTGKVILVNPNDSFLMAYGAYVDMSGETPVYEPIADYPRAWYEGSTNVKYMELVSRPLPAPTLTNCWYSASVL